MKIFVNFEKYLSNLKIGVNILLQVVHVMHVIF